MTSLSVQSTILLVGGGGGGGSGVGAVGGGAGQVLYKTNITLTIGTNYSVTIGQGGASDSNGTSTTFGTLLTAAGGGGNGVSGNGYSPGTGGDSHGGWGGGAGGGAAVNGQSGSYPNYGGNGDAGVTYLGHTVGGGGAGGSYGGGSTGFGLSPGTGGAGGGGNGGTSPPSGNQPGGNGVANTGGGGGAGSSTSGGTGGSGLAVVQYISATGALFSGGTITTVGSTVTHTFTSNDTLVSNTIPTSFVGSPIFLQGHPPPTILPSSLTPQTIVIGTPANNSGKLGYGYVKNSGTWTLPKTISYKNTANVWTTVQKAYVKNSNGTWEQWWPTPAGNLTSSSGSLTFNSYQYQYASPYQRITLTNTGNDNLVIANVVRHDGSYSSHIDTVGINSAGFPITIYPGGSTYLDVTVVGNIIGLATGNITVINGSTGGYAGSDIKLYSNIAIPITTIVSPDNVTVQANTASLAYSVYVGDPTQSQSFNITASGGNANITALTTNGTITVANVFVPGSNTVKFIANTPVFVDNGTFSDIITVYTDLLNQGPIQIPVSMTVTTPHGSQTFAEGYSTFTVPAGVHTITVNALGGGGGGGGNDASVGYYGYNGHQVTGPISVSPGDIFKIYVAGGGGGGYTGTGVGGGYSGNDHGSGYSGGSGGAAGGAGVSGGGGGGGAATVLVKNSSTILVAAGGGGGGGGGWHSPGRGQSGGQVGSHYGQDGIDHGSDGGGSGGGGGGYDGGACGALVGGDEGSYSGSDGTDLVPAGCTATTGQEPVNSGWYATGNEAPGYWCSFMATYSIWTGGSQDVTTNVYQTQITFPTSGNYTFNISADNAGYIELDGSDILDSYGGYSAFGSVASTTYSVSAGTHTITLVNTNFGGPAGIAAQIINPDGTELWNSLQATYNTPGVNAGGIAGNGGPGAVSFNW